MEMLILTPELGYGKDYLECIPENSASKRRGQKRQRSSQRLIFTLSIYGPPLEDDSRWDLEFSQHMDIFLQWSSKRTEEEWEAGDLERQLLFSMADNGTTAHTSCTKQVFPSLHFLTFRRCWDELVPDLGCPNLPWAYRIRFPNL